MTESPPPTPSPSPESSLRYVGVIEGFYGRPWSEAQRHELFVRMASWRMDTYLYAPKDDLRHRVAWRDPYPASEAAALAGLVTRARDAGVRFVYALAPGLDLDWTLDRDRAAMLAKFEHLAQLGVTDFALLFDDIPASLDSGRQAERQADATNTARAFVRELGIEGAFLFCPTEYCARRAVPNVAESPYLRTLGARLAPEIEILWTGPEVVSASVPVESIREVAAVLRRRPVLWENLHANDYAPRRVHLGPYDGRDTTLRTELAGILTNPNTQFDVNVPGVFGVADFARGGPTWTVETSLDRILDTWHADLHARGVEVRRDDLALLVDALYLPHRAGRRAEALRDAAATMPASPDIVEFVFAERAAFRRVLSALERGGHRALLYDLHPYLTDVIEELSRLLRGVGRVDTREPNGVPFPGGLAEQLSTLR